MKYPFDKYFTDEELADNHNKLVALKDKHKGEDLFILGNSPDITKEFIDKIRDKTTFAANGFIVVIDIWDYEPTYMIISDPGNFDNYLLNMLPEFEQYEDCSNSDLFLTAKCPFIFSDLVLKPIMMNEYQKSLGYDVNPANRIKRRIESCIKHIHVKVLNKDELTMPRLYKSTPSIQDICFDLLKGTYMCGTVVTNLMLPLAVWMGFKNIYLKGCSGGAGHFYDKKLQYGWDEKHQKRIYNYLYAIFKKLLTKENINIYNLDNNQIVLGKEPHIIEYKDFEEIK